MRQPQRRAIACGEDATALPRGDGEDDGEPVPQGEESAGNGAREGPCREKQGSVRPLLSSERRKARLPAGVDSVLLVFTSLTPRVFPFVRGFWRPGGTACLRHAVPDCTESAAAVTQLPRGVQIGHGEGARLRSRGQTPAERARARLQGTRLSAAHVARDSSRRARRGTRWDGATG